MTDASAADPYGPHIIVRREQLNRSTYRLRVRAPLIAEARRAGQFVILQLDTDFGERIPLTIADADTAEGTITIVFQAVGRTTHALADLREGDAIANLVGPLGRPTHVERFGTVVCVGGGIGVAPLYPIAQAMKEAGNRLIVIMGARDRSLLILEQEMSALADEHIVCTDDGSYRRKGFVSEPLGEVCGRQPAPDLVVVIGPPAMMRACCEVTRPFGVHTVASLNTIMVDGTGMCGGCRVTVGGETKFVCVDGPEFDGHLVDFDSMIRRLGAYRSDEEHAHAQCHLERAAREQQQKKKERG